GAPKVSERQGESLAGLGPSQLDARVQRRIEILAVSRQTSAYLASGASGEQPIARVRDHQIMLKMSVAQGDRCVRGGAQMLATVVAHRLEQAVADSTPRGVDFDQALVDQRGQQLPDPSVIDPVLTADPLDGVEIEGSGKNGQTVEHELLRHREQIKGPIERRSERPLPRQTSAALRSEQAKTVVQPELEPSDT